MRISVTDKSVYNTADASEQSHALVLECEQYFTTLFDVTLRTRVHLETTTYKYYITQMVDTTTQTNRVVTKPPQCAQRRSFVLEQVTTLPLFKGAATLDQPVNQKWRIESPKVSSFPPILSINADKRTI